MSIASSGLIVGVLVSVVLGRQLRPILFGITPRDPMIFASVIALLLIVALAASYIPAYKAMQLNPIEAVRHE
jgi:ABC-type antimicrobial peptide transport system permease subunit